MMACRLSVSSVLCLGLTLAAACGGPEAAGPGEPRSPATAAVPPAAHASRGILVMAHGGSDAWNAEIEAAVAPLRKSWEVEVCYGMAVSSSIEQSVQKLESRGVDQIAVVRLFVSGESWRDETAYILGIRADLPAEKVQAHASLPGHGGHGAHGGHKMEAPRPIAHTARLTMSRDGVGDSPLVDQILVDRVRALSQDPARETVLVIAHGPGDDGENDRWIAGMKQRLEPLHAQGGFKRIEVATLREDWPAKRAAAEAHIRSIVEAGNADGHVIVVPFRIAGFGPYGDVLKGLTYVSDGKGFLPHPNVTRWIEETAGALLGPTASR